MHDEAERHVRRKLELATEPRRRFDALNELTLIEDAAARYRVGIETCRQLVDAADKIGDPLLQSDAGKRLAWILGRVGRHEEALEILERFIPPIREAGDITRLAGLLSDAGGLYRAMGQFEKADACYHEALELSDQLGTDRGRAVVLLSIGGTCVLRNQPEKGLAALRESLALFRKIGSEPETAMCLSSLGSALSRSDPAEAWECFSEGLKIAQRVGNLDLRASQLAGLAMLMGRRGDFAEAEKLYLETLRIIRELGDRAGAALQLGNLGDLYHKHGRLDEAEACMVEALELARAVRSIRMEVFWLTNLAIIRLDQDATDVAALHLDEAERLSERFHDPRLQGAIHAGQAVVLRRRGREDEARPLWESGAKALAENGANQDWEAMVKRWEAAAGQ